MQHNQIIVAELRETTPSGEWEQHEATGRACVVCPCGFSTGFVDKAEAATQYRTHAHDNPPRLPVTIHPEVSEASAVLRDMLGEITRD